MLCLNQWKCGISVRGKTKLYKRAWTPSVVPRMSYVVVFVMVLVPIYVAICVLLISVKVASENMRPICPEITKLFHSYSEDLLYYTLSAPRMIAKYVNSIVNSVIFLFVLVFCLDITRATRFSTLTKR